MNKVRIGSIESLYQMLWHLMPGDTVHYTDVKGLPRSLRFHKRMAGFVPLVKGQPPSPASYYYDENGEYLRVPDFAFANVFSEGIYIQVSHV